MSPFLVKTSQIVAFIFLNKLWIRSFLFRLILLTCIVNLLNLYLLFKGISIKSLWWWIFLTWFQFSHVSIRLRINSCYNYLALVWNYPKISFMISTAFLVRVLQILYRSLNRTWTCIYATIFDSFCGCCIFTIFL